LCLVSVNGPRETYFVDGPRICGVRKFADVSGADNLSAICEPTV
jgi:hypothetical protein